MHVDELNARTPEGYCWLLRTDEKFGYFCSLVKQGFVGQITIVNGKDISPQPTKTEVSKAYGPTARDAFEMALKTLNMAGVI